MQQIACGFALLLASGVFTLILRRLYTSPLRNFQGPILASLSEYYCGYYDVILQGRLLAHLKSLHERYGPVVRIAPNRLHFCRPQAYFDIYRADNSMVKDRQLYAVLGINDSSIGIVDVKSSQIRREMLSPFFSRRATLELEGVIQTKIDKFIGLLLKDQSQRKPVNAHYGLRCLTLDIIWQYCFGDDFKSMDAKDFRHPTVASIQTQIRIFWILKYLPFLFPTIIAMPPRILQILRPSLLDYIDSRKRCTQMVESLLENPNSLNDLEQRTVFHYLLIPDEQKKERHATPPKKALVDEAMALVQAGSDTVANTCIFGIFHVLDNPDIFRKLQDELLSAWPRPETQVGLQVLEQLPYLTAVIKESLRHVTGVVTPLTRVVGPDGAKIDGFFVPPGTVVGMSAAFLHENEKIFPEPGRFLPERWLEDPSKDQYLLAFSRGPRMCMGHRLAWAEMYLILANVFRKVEMTPHETTIEDFRTYRELFVPVYEGREFHVMVGPNKH